jgi:hypothetical protein
MTTTPNSNFRPVRRRLAASLLLLVLTTGLATGRAQFIDAADASGNSKTQFRSNEPVAVWVQSGTFAEGMVCVVPVGADAAEENDVTAGGCNSVSFGLQFLIVWQPPLTPGQYDVVVRNASGGEARQRIRVVAAAGPPTVNVAALKAAAGAMAGPWEEQANRAQNLSQNATAISAALSFASGDFLGGAVNVVSYAVGEVPALAPGLATDYNAAVLTAGGAVLEAIARGVANQYRDLEADPPDPNFTVFTPFSVGVFNERLAARAGQYPGLLLAFPYRDHAQSALAKSQTVLANSLALEASWVAAVIPALERLQGAQNAANDSFALLQARLLNRHLNHLLTQRAETRAALIAYRAELAAAGLADVPFDSAQLRAQRQRLAERGISPAERRRLLATGFAEADLQFILERAAAVTPPDGTFSRGGLIDSLVAGLDATQAGFTEAAAKAGELVAYLQNRVTPTHPTAVAGGPYAGREGTAIPLNATGSSDPQGQPLTYAWDFDLDGEFDDATGATPSFSLDRPATTWVGVRATDPDGNQALDYALVRVADHNRPPVITAVSPAEPLIVAPPGGKVRFSAAAADPDGDPITFEWFLDGVSVGTGPLWEYAAPPTAGAARTVMVVARDNSPLSEDSREARRVATGAPEIAWLGQVDGDWLLWCFGRLAGSSDLVNWTADPAARSGGVLLAPTGPQRFFRAEAVR